MLFCSSADGPSGCSHIWLPWIWVHTHLLKPPLSTSVCLFSYPVASSALRINTLSSSLRIAFQGPLSIPNCKAQQKMIRKTFLTINLQEKLLHFLVCILLLNCPLLIPGHIKPSIILFTRQHVVCKAGSGGWSDSLPYDVWGTRLFCYFMTFGTCSRRLAAVLLHHSVTSFPVLQTELPKP